MMLRRMVLAGIAVAVLSSSAFAQDVPKPATPSKATTGQTGQTPPPPPPPKPATATTQKPPPPPPPPPQPRGQPVNLQIEIVITEHRPSGTPVKKTVSLVVADQRSGMIRSDATVPNVGSMAPLTVPNVGLTVPLSVDANPEILKDGKIRLGLNVFYDLPGEGAAGVSSTSESRAIRMSIRKNVSVVLESGKSMLVTQSADPVGDRQVTVEVKATVLR